MQRVLVYYLEEMKKAFHVGFINDQEDINLLAEELRKHVEKF
jgi:hypothetical protein